MSRHSLGLVDHVAAHYGTSVDAIVAANPHKTARYVVGLGTVFDDMAEGETFNLPASASTVGDAGEDTLDACTKGGFIFTIEPDAVAGVAGTLGGQGDPCTTTAGQNGTINANGVCVAKVPPHGGQHKGHDPNPRGGPVWWGMPPPPHRGGQVLGAHGHARGSGPYAQPGHPCIDANGAKGVVDTYGNCADPYGQLYAVQDAAEMLTACSSDNDCASGQHCGSDGSCHGSTTAIGDACVDANGNPGTIWPDGKCVTSACGAHSHILADKKCHCDAGYTWASTKNNDCKPAQGRAIRKVLNRY